jgi:hypothetical protein
MQQYLKLDIKIKDIPNNQHKNHSFRDKILIENDIKLRLIRCQSAPPLNERVGSG